MISKDIEELAKEKLALETDIAQKEADIKIKSGEIKSLQVCECGMLIFAPKLIYRGFCTFYFG
jgi:hypothetical protein